jgi:predicted nucleic acid-binding protein
LITQNESILSPTSETYSIVQELISRFPGGGNQIFDLYLVATMLSHNIQTIATDNQKHFQLFHGITITNPFT